jgi:transcriptional regulator with XRE-family HTH domain
MVGKSISGDAMQRETQQRPSEVFVRRLRDTREDRRLSQAELAERMRAQGQPMSKQALLALENGRRGVSLDEAVALAAVLHVAFSHLLSPPGDEYVWLTEKQGVDAEGMRAWLLHGDDFVATWGDYQAGERESAFGRALLVHARAYIDAERGDDKGGKARELAELVKVAASYHKLAEEERR